MVFDLDGTLLDNMALHAEAFRIFMGRHGLAWGSGGTGESPPLNDRARIHSARAHDDMRAKLDGKRNRDIFPVLFGRALPDEDLRRFSAEKEGLYRELSRGRLVALSGLDRLLERLHARGIPVAIATSAPPENVRHTLAELGLDTRLDRVVRADEVPRGKPHPDVFLAAARLLDVPPEDCLAFEDAPAGVAAAKAAGMTCVGVTTSFDAEALASGGGGPDFTVADFDEFLAGPGGWLLD
jgi:HAD superfamily hydrolase (TIGR01509 family)